MISRCTNTALCRYCNPSALFRSHLYKFAVIRLSQEEIFGPNHFMQRSRMLRHIIQFHIHFFEINNIVQWKDIWVKEKWPGVSFHLPRLSALDNLYDNRFLFRCYSRKCITNLPLPKVTMDVNFLFFQIFLNGGAKKRWISELHDRKLICKIKSICTLIGLKWSQLEN